MKTWGNYRASYNYCRICGYTPQTKNHEPNRAPILFWQPDDGYIIGTLCRHCFDDYAHASPHPDDYAYQFLNNISVETDEDPIEAL